MATLDSHRERLTRNTAYLTAAFVGQKLLTSVYYFVFANLLGPDLTGSYLFIVAFANLFGILTDVGISPILIREVARRPERARELFRATLRFKLVTGLLTLGALALTTPLFIHTALRRELLVFAAAYVVLESLSLTAYGIFRGLQRLRVEAIGSTIAQAVPLVIGSLGLWLTRNPIWLGISLLASSLTNVLYSTGRLRTVLQGLPSANSPRLPWNWKTISPFFVSGILQRIYGYVDIFLMGILVSGQSVGFYGTAYRITYATQFLPIAFNTSLYPALSQAFHESKEVLQQLAERSLRVLLVLGLPVAVIIAVHARPLLEFLFPDYVGATLALQLSVASVPMLFTNFLFSSLLNATNRQTRNTMALGVVAGLSLGLNLILIPIWQHVGASLAALIATSVLAIVSGWFARDALRWTRQTSLFVIRLMMASIVTALIGFVLQRQLQVVLSAAIAGLTFVVLIVSTRAFTLTDLRSVVSVFRRRPS